MMFAMVFLIIGVALFVLIRSSNDATELERKDVKAFNVAEAGVDAAMAELKAGWPRFETGARRLPWTPRSSGASTPTRRSSPIPATASSSTRSPTTTPPTTQPQLRTTESPHDSNRDDIMWVDSEADVDNDRHRILVLVTRLKIPVELPDVALVANTAGGNGQGLDVSVDPDYTGSIPEVNGATGAAVVYTGKGTFNKDVSPGANIQVITVPANPFWSYVSPALIGNLERWPLVRNLRRSSSTMRRRQASSSVTRTLGPGVWSTWKAPKNRS